MNWVAAWNKSQHCHWISCNFSRKTFDIGPLRIIKETENFRRNSTVKTDDDNLVILPSLISSRTLTVFVFNKIMEGNGSGITLFTEVELFKTWLVIQKPQGKRCFVVYVLESIQQITTYCSESFVFIAACKSATTKHASYLVQSVCYWNKHLIPEQFLRISSRFYL